MQHDDRSVYAIEVLGAQSATEGEGHGILLQTTSYDQEPLSPEGAESVDIFYGRLRGNALARSAGRSLAQGIRLAQTGSSETLAESLLAYFKVIEGVARAVPWEPPVDQDDRQERILRQLGISLKSGKATRRRVAAVRDSATALDRLDARYLGQRLDHAGDVLLMPRSWRHKATSFAELRNKHLGHAGGDVDPARVAIWVDQEQEWTGYTLARDFLTAYVRSLDDK